MSVNLSQYPKKGSIFPSRGLNLFDALFDVRFDEAVLLQNMIFVQKSLLERKPFRNVNEAVYAAFMGAHDYKGVDGEPRLLFYTTDGKIQEISVDGDVVRQTGLATGVPGFFTTSFDSVFFTNGQNDLRVARGTTWRLAGSPVAINNLSATSAIELGGVLDGDYNYIVVPTIEVGGVSRVFADWSNVLQVTVGPLSTITLHWTDVVDARITAYLIFRTEAGASDLRSLAKVAPGTQTYVDDGSVLLPAVVSGSPSRPSPLGSWGPPVIARIVIMSGNRLVLAGLQGNENAIMTSRLGGSSFDVEGFPSDNSTFLRLPKDGSLTAAFPIGDTGENSTRSTGLFLGQGSACYMLPESDPNIPLIAMSESIGPLHQRAIAQDGPALFFQSRRGVEYWPGTGKDIYLISDKVKPIFVGGGSQNLTANQSDSDITYTIAKDQLWITIRDRGDVAYANKVYCLDLLTFRRGFDPGSPTSAARFTGPIVSPNLSIPLMLRRLDNTLIAFDSQNGKVLSYQEITFQDQVAGANVNIAVHLKTGALLKEDPMSQKVVNYLHLMALSSSVVKVGISQEYSTETVIYADAEPNTSTFSWEDIDWSDITWLEGTWFFDLPLGYGDVSCKWLTISVKKEDNQSNFAFFGILLWLWPFKQIRSLR